LEPAPATELPRAMENRHAWRYLRTFSLAAFAIYCISAMSGEPGGPLAMREPERICAVSDERVDIIGLEECQANPDTKIEGGNIRLVKEGIEMEPELSYCVPKSLHFIWLGKMLPEKYQKNIHTFRKHNPDYQINLWTELISDELRKNLSTVDIHDINSILDEFVVKPLYDKEENVGGRSDILRYEVIYRNGGVYFDTDSVCVKPFKDVLTHSFVSHVEGWKNICNGVFGFPKGSKFLEYVFRALEWNINDDENLGVPWKTGPAFLSGAYINYNDTLINMINQKYLVNAETNNSLVYQTMDAAWM